MLSLILSLLIGQVTPTSAYIGKSGQTVFVVAPKTAPVVTLPTLTVNGQSVPLASGPVSGGFWAFSLAPDATTGAPAKSINPSDVVSIGAPVGWATGAPALSMAVRNSAGRCEYPIPDQPTMALGVNVSQAFLQDGWSWCVPKNWAYRMRAWNWAGPVVTTFDPAGNPSRIARPSISAPFLSQPYPGHAGLWTVVYDSPDPRTVLSIGLGYPWSAQGWTVTPRADLSSPGASGIGITRVFDVQPAPTAKPQRGPVLELYLSHPTGSPTFGNLWIIPPGNDLDRSDPLAVDQRILDKLMIGGGRGPSILRFMDSCAAPAGQSNIVDPADLPAPGRSVARTIRASITSIRPLDLTASPSITTVYGPVAIPDKGIWLGGRWLAEAVCAIPHGLATGQMATITGLPPLSAGGKTIPAVATTSMVWVTSPTTFVITPYSAALGQTRPDLDGSITTPGATATVALPPGAILPFEFAAAMASQFRGCGLWVNIPTAASDATIDAIAAKVLSRLGPTNWVVVEYANECWNWGWWQSNYTYTMGALGGQPRGWTDYYTVRRAAEAAARVRAVFAAAGRPPTDVKLCLAGQFSWMAGRPLLSYAASQSIRADVVSAAPYFDVPWGAQTRGWTTEQVHDLARAYLMLDPTPKAYWADWTKAVATYEAAIGQRVQRIAYEGGIETMPAAAWDWGSHPDAADTERVLFSQAQAAGFDGFVYFNMLDQPRSNGNNYGLWNWQDQLAGTGDGRDGRAMNRQGAQGAGVVSTRGEAWRGWQRAMWLSR